MILEKFMKAHDPRLKIIPADYLMRATKDMQIHNTTTAKQIRSTQINLNPLIGER
jgi:hypothetical protein